jgi:hypothetical protein
MIITMIITMIIIVFLKDKHITVSIIVIFRFSCFQHVLLFAQFPNPETPSPGQRLKAPRHIQTQCRFHASAAMPAKHGTFSSAQLMLWTYE